ncbi:unknown [Dialister sp. CAG:357]|nr:unknown [Dialister sp. CAG:357]
MLIIERFRIKPQIFIIFRPPVQAVKFKPCQLIIINKPAVLYISIVSINKKRDLIVT